MRESWIADDQKVISTGPYAVARHPIYATELLLFMVTPLGLGSYWGLLTFVAVLAAPGRGAVSLEELAGV